jgi:hypothetical protein
MIQMESETLPLDGIRIDGGTQPRERIDESAVQEYAEAMDSGSEFPPVVVFFDGAEHWLADGFHRYHAHRRLLRDEIAVEVHEGTRRDAVLYSVGANATHGMRRTNQDKRRAVDTLLMDDEWSGWSDREIARRCGVSDRTVNRIRSEFTASMSQLDDPAPTARTYTDKHGNVSEMNVENIGKRRELQRREPIQLPEIYNRPGTPEPNYYNVSLPVSSSDSAAILLCELCPDSYLRQLIEFIERHLEGDDSWR